MRAAKSMACTLALGLVAPALLAGTAFEVPLAAAKGENVARGTSCCGQLASRCCESACCGMPANPSERSPSNPPSRSNDRLQDGKLVWSSFSDGVATMNTGLTLRRFSEILPTSGSPSLVSEHIRLQI
jgi:hypothetical protein